MQTRVWAYLWWSPCVFLSCWNVCSAWDADGMAAIGMTTMSGVRGEALTQLKRLLGGKDVVDVAHWPKSVVNKYPELEVIFQQFQDRDPSRRVDCKHFDASENCSHGHCIVKAAQYFYANLIAKPELAPQDFVLPVKLKLTDTDRMKFLVALLADLHSPSKFGYMFNRAGRDVSVSLPDSNKIKRVSLYDYWDSELIQKVIRERPNFWYSGWTHFNSLGRPFFDAQAQEWNAATAEARLSLFEKWAAASFESSCDRAQRRQPVLLNSTEISELDLLIPNDFAHTAATVFMDFEFLKGKILLGGIRSSIVLNSILATREAKKLRQGTGVKVKPDKMHAPHWASATERDTNLSRWTRNFGINICIISLVVGVFAMFLKYGSSSARSTVPQAKTTQMKTKE